MRFASSIVAIVRAFTVEQGHSREMLRRLLAPLGCCNYVGLFRSCKESSQDAPVHTLSN